MNAKKADVSLILSLILNAITGGLARLSRPAALRLGRGLGWIYGSVLRHRRPGGKGALMLTAPLGNFDLLAMFSAQRGYPLTIISKEIKNPAVNGLWMCLRERYGIKIVLSHNSMRGCFKALKGDGVLGFILDQNRPHDQGVFVPFFGRPACTTPGLAFISAATQAPVAPVFIHRTADGRHHLRAFPALA